MREKKRKSCTSVVILVQFKFQADSLEGDKISVLSEQINAYHPFLLTAPISKAAAGFSFLNSMQFKITQNLH